MSFARGTIVVPFDRQEKNRDEIQAIMESVAALDGVTVHSLTSGQSTIGTAGVNVGGRSFAELQQPKVMVVIGRDTDLYNAGEIWHLLDYRMQMPLTLRDRNRLAEIDWNEYTHIVFPGGEYENYMPAYADRIRQWVAEGGTLIGIRQGAYWVRDNVLDYVEPIAGEALEPEEDPDTGTGHDELLAEEAADAERHDYADKQDIEAAGPRSRRNCFRRSRYHTPARLRLCRQKHCFTQEPERYPGAAAGSFCDSDQLPDTAGPVRIRIGRKPVRHRRDSGTDRRTKR